MLNDPDDDFQIAPPDEPSLTEGERRNYDNFVREYLVDYDYTGAALRLGYAKGQASLWGKKLKHHPYIERRIAEAMSAQWDDPEAVVAQHKQRVLNSLMKEATYSGPGASHAARVTALSKLAQIHGLEAPAKTESKVIHEGKQELVVSHSIDYGSLDKNDLSLVRALLEKRVDVNA